MLCRKQITVKGIVQGVGFRPFIYSLANRYSLSGYVLNDSGGVIVDAEGEESSLEQFIRDVVVDAPPLAEVEDIHWIPLPVAGYDSFSIEESRAEEEKSVLISPDISICEDCLRELFDTYDFRYRYPFINCTNCGPRFTIIRDVPYDRGKTTMAKFPMCATCRWEYEDPANRRFHAQPNACPACGPQVVLLDKRGNPVEGSGVIASVQELLRNGEMVAIKGIGGYHLACDARNSQAVTTLRKRKYREDKPFALMAYDVDSVREICEVSPSEEKLLLSPSRPIVLMRKKGHCSVAEDVAPHQRYLGVMLPYTPLHCLLLHGTGLILVMTSGNRSDEPIAHEDGEAFSKLGGIAGYFLIHNRDIHIRCDDSVARAWRDQPILIRRARGYVPSPMRLPFSLERHILSCGAELKNTFCLAKDDRAFVSHHIGDLDSVETLRSFEQGIEHFKRLFAIEPEVVAYDLHPEYLSTKYALALEGNHKLGVQHHHAHIVSCMVDNGIEGKVIGVAFDGTGYGLDGTIWGGEFLVADFYDFQRLAHLKPLPLPGGEAAIREPWRMAVSYLYAVYGDDFLKLDFELVNRIDRGRLRLVKQMMDRRFNSPPTSSMGRLFDAVSSLLGIRDRVNYEGQAAVELEMIAGEDCSNGYECRVTNGRDDTLIIETVGLIQGVVEDLGAGIERSVISAKFHNTVAHMILDVCRRIRDKSGIGRVALSGGVFQNMFLLQRVDRLLFKAGFDVYTHHRVPPNDGGISLGQAVVAAMRR